MSDSASASETIGDRGELHENGFECVGNDEILEATNDAHGGVIVEMKKPMEPQVFLTLLRASLLQWKKQRKEGVWIKLPIELVNLAETAVKEGFWFHHAEPSYVMLVYWIPQTGSTIPPNASHRVSVGAIVLNDKKEVLVVQEKRGIFHGLGVWKIPTGVVDAGEDLFAAAIREVKEETGVGVLPMLLYFSNAWMAFEEYAAQPFTQKHEPFKYINEFCLAKLQKNYYAGFSARPLSSFFKDHLGFLYLNSHDLDNHFL
ncbi:nudix hydrolase 10-like [Senna tora]|uniref:Nudix hydrolase 10-like n=1 Tax=Senna tora TaxID=362788 RepID=A0A834WRB6_9FABA|nr:nudix hydrolase 10-like [Senna tora]